MIAGERFLFRGRTVWKLDYGEEYVKKVSSRRNETEKVSVLLHPLSISLFLWTKNNKLGKNILNAQISWAIYTVAACLSCLILIGFVLAPVVVIAWIVFSIIAAVKAANGNYDYVAPFTIKFLK